MDGGDSQPRKIANPIVSASEQVRRVRRREELDSVADALVLLGDAPDGRPLVLDVRRAVAIGASIDRDLGSPTVLPPVVAGAIAQLESVLAQAARTAGLVDVRGAKLYRTGATVGELLGATMLARALGSHSPIASPGHDGAEVPGSTAIATSAMAHAMSAPVTVMKTPTTGQRHVGVPLRAGSTFLVEATDVVEPESLQPLRLEDLRGLPSAKFRVSKGGETNEGSLVDGDAYATALASLHAQRSDDATIEWSLGAADLGRVIAHLARSAGALHDEGRVHADIKPANAVITSNGAAVIDPIGVVAGQLSPGATPGWAAPEQVLSRPVVPSTDVYPLGLMLAKLLGAVIYGEERTFVIPTGRGQRRRVQLLSEHDVYVDPSLDVPAVVRSGWEALIRHAVEFDADDRIASAYAFAERVEALLAAAPLSHRVWFAAGPGRIDANIDVLGVAQPVWLVRDHRGPL